MEGMVAPNPMTADELKAAGRRLVDQRVDWLTGWLVDHT